jgi:hypothetical protein
VVAEENTIPRGKQRRIVAGSPCSFGGGDVAMGMPMAARSSVALLKPALGVTFLREPHAVRPVGSSRVAGHLLVGHGAH